MHILLQSCLHSIKITLFAELLLKFLSYKKKDKFVPMTICLNFIIYFSSRMLWILLQLNYILSLKDDAGKIHDSLT